MDAVAAGVLLQKLDTVSVLVDPLSESNDGDGLSSDIESLESSEENFIS